MECHHQVNKHRVPESFMSINSLEVLVIPLLLRTLSAYGLINIISKETLFIIHNRV